MLCQNASSLLETKKKKKKQWFNLPDNIEATQSSLLLVVNDAIMQMAYLLASVSEAAYYS